MYNGIGLRTPRGSGTSGYIERSRVSQKRDTAKHSKPAKKRDLVSECLKDFDERRKIELECYKLKKRMMESKSQESEIETAVSELRKSLVERLESKKKETDDTA